VNGESDRTSLTRQFAGRRFLTTCLPQNNRDVARRSGGVNLRSVASQAMQEQGAEVTPEHPAIAVPDVSTETPAGDGLEMVSVAAGTPVASEAQRGGALRKRSGARLQATLVALDLLALALSAGVGVAVAVVIGQSGIPVWEVLAVLPIMVGSLLLHGMYRGNGLRLVPSGMAVFSTVAHSLPVALLAMLGAFFSAGWEHGSGALFTVSLCLLLPCLLTIPAVRSTSAHMGARFGMGHKQRVLVVGAGEVADHVMSRLERHGLITPVGMVDDDPLPGFETIGTLHDIPELCESLEIDRIIVAIPRAPWLSVSEVIQPLIGMVDVAVVPSLYELMTWRSGTADLAGMPLIPLLPAQRSFAARCSKRAIDLVVGLLAVLAMAPVLVAAAVAIKLGSNGPVFFRQARTGRNGEMFRIWKFRTMVVDAEQQYAELKALSDADGPRFKMNMDPRVTKVGALLRRFSIDELPQLFNVLQGSMSLVGPRPFPVDQSEALYLDPAVSRFEMPPGMTGLWQVSGRSDLVWDDLCRLDSVYVRSWSLLWDLRILAQTPAAVFRRRGAY
jgi:exopolysaccharide biosynthesis polyprenyl glycosylphosphotransferase